MVQFYDLCEDTSQENITHFNLYSPIARVHADYHGCLPSDDDAADYIRHVRIRAIKVS
ncbi:hypothetical protein [Lysinibacillus sp. TE18511]